MSYRLDRFEMKFVITREQRAAISPELDQRMMPDENAGEDAYYPIVSLYYDNPERDCYWEQVRGYPSRRKMRVRVYGSLDGRLAPTIFVEIKHKCDGRGVKRRLRVPLEEAYSICDGNDPRIPLGVLDMKLPVFLLALVFPLAVWADDYEARTFSGSDGTTLGYRLLSPQNYDKAQKYPLVVFLHGIFRARTDPHPEIHHAL